MNKVAYLVALLGTAFAVEDLMPSFFWETGAACPQGFQYCGTLVFCDPPGPLPYGYMQEGGVCTSPGPILRFRGGNLYHIRFRNDVPGVTTNLHTHGLHISGSGNADDVTRHVDYGGCLGYVYDLKHTHYGGTYWYHAHIHGSTEMQVDGGAVGMLIVEDVPHALLVSAGVSAFLTNEKILMSVLSDFSWRGNGVDSRPANFDLLEHTWYRFRLGTSVANAEGITYFVSPQCHARPIAYDGVLTNVVPQPAGSAFPGNGASRIDLAVICGSNGAIYVDDQLIATLSVFSGAPLNPNPTPFMVDQNGQDRTWVPPRPEYLQDLRGARVDERFDVFLTSDDINGRKFDKDVPLATIGYGKVHEWTIHETHRHPFHLHLYHFQIVTRGGCGSYREGEWYDTIAAQGACTVRFKALDVAERCILHCHILHHEDNGVMGWVNVVSPTGDHPRQPVFPGIFNEPVNCQTGQPLAPPTPPTPPSRSPRSPRGGRSPPSSIWDWFGRRRGGGGGGGGGRGNSCPARRPYSACGRCWRSARDASRMGC